MFLFQSSFFQAMLKYKINRRVIVWGFLALFILYPLSKDTFSVMIKKISLTKSNDIDPHAYVVNSHIKNLDINLHTELDSNFILMPNLKNGHLGFYFVDNHSNNFLNLKFISVHQIDQLKNYFNRTHPLRLPIKNDLSQKSLRNYFLNNLHLNSHYLKEAILNNGPFLNFINDTKLYFISGLNDEEIEEVQFSESNPVILMRDHSKAKVFFISKNKVFIFQYDRPEKQVLENAFLEKILAKIDTSLIKSSNGQVSFLEMFDTLPQVDVQIFLDFMIQSKNKIIENNLLSLKDFYNQNLKESGLELKKVSRNAETIIADQITRLNFK